MVPAARAQVKAFAVVETIYAAPSASAAAAAQAVANCFGRRIASSTSPSPCQLLPVASSSPSPPSPSPFLFVSVLVLKIASSFAQNQPLAFDVILQLRLFDASVRFPLEPSDEQFRHRFPVVFEGLGGEVVGDAMGLRRVLLMFV